MCSTGHLLNKVSRSACEPFSKENQGGEVRGGVVEKGKGTHPITCRHEPWTWTKVWGWPMEWEVLGGGGQREKNWDNHNSVNNKI